MVSAKLISITIIAIIAVNVENANATKEGEGIIILYRNMFNYYSINTEFFKLLCTLIFIRIS